MILQVPLPILPMIVESLLHAEDSCHWEHLLVVEQMVEELAVSHSRYTQENVV